MVDELLGWKFLIRIRWARGVFRKAEAFPEQELCSSSQSVGEGLQVSARRKLACYFSR